MVHPRFRFAGREKVGEVGNRLKHFLNATPSLFLAARGASGSTSKRQRSTVLPIATRIRMAGAILATGVRLEDKCTHLWRHAAHASSARIDLADLRFPY